MCGIFRYIHKRCYSLFRERPKNSGDKHLLKTEPLSKVKESEEYRYNAKQVNDFVRNIQRQYWTNY